MYSSSIRTVLIVVLTMMLTSAVDAKPLKVFILCGQSNMEGHAQTRTFPAIAHDPKTAAMYKEMVDNAGEPIVCENVWISYAFGDFYGNPKDPKAGKLTAGWGSQHHIGTGKIGPEFTFGIYMSKMLGEPILIIKNAWGGKSLMVDFRPPSGGDLPDTVNEKAKERAGNYYKLMMEHVKSVLADPKRVCPAYDPEEGYELAGFVWFQGFNDLVGPYPRMEPEQAGASIKDYSEYSRLLACFIRDVRKDLSAPNMPFVTGVLGVGGPNTSEGGIAFRKAMAAPAELDEFKGNVVNVFTDKYWPTELDAVLAKEAPFKSERNRRGKELSAKALERAEHIKESEKIKAEIRAKIENVLTEDELFLLDNGVSNQGYHYYGSAKFFGQIGRAFAEALVEKPAPK